MIMNGVRVTITRERPDLRRTITVRGEVTGVDRDEHAAVAGVLVRGTRDDGTSVHGWYAVGPGALDGSLVTSQSATVDACGHDIAACPCHTRTARQMLVCTECGERRPDADVEGEGVSRGAPCDWIECTGTFQDPEEV